MISSEFSPVTYYLSGWPTDIVAFPEDLKTVWLGNVLITSLSPRLTQVEGDIRLHKEMAFDLPLIPGLSVALLNNSGVTEFGVSFKLEEGEFELGCTSLSAAVRFASGLLKRMEHAGTGYIEAPPDPVTGEPQPIEVALSGGDLTFNSRGEFSFTFDGSAPPLTLQPFMIGDTGIIVDVQGLILVLGEEDATNLPATIDPTWRGIFLDQATITLPEEIAGILPTSLSIDDAFIGSGGFSGSVQMDWEASDGVTAYDPANATDFLGFSFTLQSISIDIQQNALTGSSIVGFLKVPFFDEALKVDIGLTNDGDFTISFGTGSGLLTLRKPDVISIDVDSLAFVKEGAEYQFILSGSVTPEVGGLDWPTFELQSLSISSSGQVKVEGGWIELPEMKTLDFHGFKVEISQLGFGTDEDGGTDFNWIGFSGGIQIVGSLPLRGGVEGLKVMWNRVTNEPKLKIGGVSLGFEIDNVLTFDGKAYFMDEEDPNTQEQVRGFKGGFEVNLIPLNGAGFDAQFIAGNKATYNFFYLFLDVNLPMGIPVLPPAVGLYGLSGLFGYNMTLDYQQLVADFASEPRPEMTDVDNWVDQEGALAFGAGVTVGTLADNGFTAKGKVLFAILVPGPVILIEGQAKILSFNEDYPYSVLAVLDVGSGTFLMNIGAEYAFPKNSGDLLDVSGTAEAYFTTGDLNGWHLYLGQKTPDTQRIRADVISFFKADAYLMIDQQGLDFGVWIGYSLDKKYGPLRVVLESWISGDMSVSWMPLQAKGSITWYGRAELSAFKIGLGVSVEATASVEVPKPLSLTGEVKVQLKTPVGKPKATVKVKWEKEGTPAYPIPLAKTLGIEHRKVSESWDVVKSSRYGADGDGLWDGDSSQNDVPAEHTLQEVPPDVQLVLNFDKSVVDAGLVAGNNPDVPEPESSGAYEFEYELTGIALEYSESYSNPNWQPFELAGTDYALTAAWQALPDPDGMVNTKLVINAQSSLEIARVLDDSTHWISLLSLYNPDYPCIDPVVLQWSKVDFEDYDTEAEFYPMFIENGWTFIALFPMLVQSYDAPWLGTDQALTTALTVYLTRCLLLPELEPTGQQSTIVAKELTFHACSDPNGFLSFVPYVELREGSVWLDYERTTELLIDHSSRNVVQGVVPAYIEAPNASNEWPMTVSITLMVRVTPDTKMIARDAFGVVVDEVDEFSDCRRNPHTYEMNSDNGNPIRKVEFIGTEWQIKEICWLEKYDTDANNIWVRMPEEMNQLILDFGKGSKGSVQFFDEVDQELEVVDFNVPEDGTDDRAEPVILEVEHLAFKSILITGIFNLIRIQGLPQSSVNAVADYEERTTQFRTTLEENWGKHTAQILLPNKYYRLKIDTTTKRKKKSNDNWTPEDFTEYMYFKTGDPAGIYNSRTPVALDPADSASSYPAAGPLKDIAPYVEATIPTGAPPNEPQVLHYRSYDVGLVFNDSYIEQMYHAAGYALGIKILDNNLDPVLDENGDDIFINGWGDNTELALTEEENLYQTFWDTDCVGVSTVDPESKQELIARAPHLALKPRTQYKAQVWADEAYMLYEFAFMTSRYASFVHQMHDFQDVAWDLQSLQINPNFSVDVAALTAALNNAEGNEEWVQFEQLMEVFDLNPRPLPRRMEVALLNGAAQSYGLLIESPESISADRVSEVELKRTNKSRTIAEFDGIVKLVRANQAKVEVLLLEDADVSGYMIEFRNDNDPAGSPYTHYFTFPAGSNYPAGTLLIIFNGEAPATLPDSENTVHYAGHLAASITFVRTNVRLLDAQSVVHHDRLFIRNDRLAAQDIRVIRSQDATRMFVFVEENGIPYSDLPDAAYRLSLTYLRDIGEDGLLLRRHGFTGAEDVQVEFSLPALLPG